MENFDSDLKSLLGKSEQLAFNEGHVVTIMYNILCSINLIHTSNIMHRDIKPANILINENCHVRICDFGLSRPVPQNIHTPNRESISKVQ